MDDRDNDKTKRQNISLCRVDLTNFKTKYFVSAERRDEIFRGA